MSGIVHVQTTVQTVFGVLDDEGNVIGQEPIMVTINRFNPAAFTEAHATIARARDQAAAQMATAPTPSETSGELPAS